MISFSGELIGASRDYASGKLQITLSCNENITDYIDILKNDKLAIKIGKFRNSRSKDANALLWSCIGEISTVLNSDKWEIYLQMLKRYGKFTYICVKPEVVDAVKDQWRECEEIGRVSINGKEAVQMLCYFGSSTYDTKEFSVLLDGVISEMRELGIQPPASEEMERSLKIWEKKIS